MVSNVCLFLFFFQTCDRYDEVITGKPSYGNVYSALNAVSGHYNNFGTKAG